MYIKFIKRTLDLTAAILSLIILAPLLIIISLLIKIDSRGPLIFKQSRVGRNNVRFTILKFRSMKVDTPDIATDDLNNPDKYLTRVGKIIRKTSLDEIPQLINILRGEMTIVGPRPALYNQYNLIKLRNVNGIDNLLPGLTGYAQIMGRDSISEKQKVNYDLYYLQHVTMLFDLKIILWTIFKVLKLEGVKG